RGLAAVLRIRAPGAGDGLLPHGYHVFGRRGPVPARELTRAATVEAGAQTRCAPSSIRFVAHVDRCDAAAHGPRESGFTCHRGSLTAVNDPREGKCLVARFAAVYLNLEKPEIESLDGAQLTDRVTEVFRRDSRISSVVNVPPAVTAFRNIFPRIDDT